LDQKIYEEISIKLNQMTPSLINEGMVYFRESPALVERFDENSLREIVQQGVTTLRDVLLGAIQFDRPQLLGGELQWLERLLEARQVDVQTLRDHLSRIRERISNELTPEQAAFVLPVFDQAVSQVKGLSGDN
jgi:hypothetical protein